MMKTFKFGLVSLLFGLIGLTCFSSAGSYTYTGSYSGTPSNSNSINPIIEFSVPQVSVMVSSSNINISCFVSNFSGDVGNYNITFRSVNPGKTYYTNQSSLKSVSSSSFFGGSVFNYNGGLQGDYYIYGFLAFVIPNQSFAISFDWSCTLSGDNIIDQSSLGVQCPEVDTGAILSGYVSESLLNECITEKTNCQSSISGYDNALSSCSNSLNTCNTNLNSCLLSNCGDIQWSALYINNIQHLSAPIINIDIPEEINWDYTGNENSFDLNIEGYNVDSDYISGIINTQNSKPNNQDFNNIITGLLPLLVPGFVIILFIYFIFRLIKKIF